MILGRKVETVGGGGVGDQLSKITLEAVWRTGFPVSKAWADPQASTDHADFTQRGSTEASVCAAQACNTDLVNLVKDIRRPCHEPSDSKGPRTWKLTPGPRTAHPGMKKFVQGVNSAVTQKEKRSPWTTTDWSSEVNFTFCCCEEAKPYFPSFVGTVQLHSCFH